MDIKSGNPYPAGALSNFARHPFEFDGVKCESLEGFLQGLKFKNPDMQKHICSLYGAHAKKSGANKNWHISQTLWWKGQPIKRESEEYQQLLYKAFEQCYKTNESAKKALLATRNATLTHSIGRTNAKETVLTRTEFSYILTKVREELLLKDAGVEY